MFLSISARFLVNVEALNMVESVGNVARHRRAPIIVPGERSTEYVLVYAPVISGESLANAYQRWLANIAPQENLPVCSNCSQAFFVKHGDREVFGDLEWEVKLKDIIEGFAGRRRIDTWNKLRDYAMEISSSAEIILKEWSDKVNEWIEEKEKTPQREEISTLREELRALCMDYMEKSVIANCVVEDIGGFMLPEEFPIKRTSKFQVGFMVPAYDQIRSSALEAQFHVRYAPDPARHRIYYVELGSALYTFHFNLDIDGIGYTSMMKREPAVDDDERRLRIKVAIEALTQMLENKLFGARLSRYTPINDLRSLMVTVGDPLPFTSSLGHEPEYIKDTIERGRHFSKVFTNESIAGWFINNEGLDVESVKEDRIQIEEVSTISEAFKNVIDFVTERLGN